MTAQPDSGNKPRPAGPPTNRKASSRSRGRRRALDVLFEADQRRLDISRLAAERLEGESPVTEYARRVVAGVAANLTSIDETLETYSLGWPLARMPAVDRAIARLGVHEIVWADDVPDPVAMADAADMASELSTPKSADFLSGLLGRISAMKSGMAPASQPAEPD